jgi:hypothetical protein
LRRAAKRDASEGAIVDYLKAAGWSWEPHSARNGPDGFGGKHGLCVPIECKTGNKPLRKGQKEWHANWRGGPVYVLRCVEDAMALDRAINKLAKR